MARTRPWLLELLRFLVYGVLGIAIILMIVRSKGYRVAFREIDARRSAPVAPVDFGTEDARPRLVQDFPTDQGPLNVILVIGDGLGFSHLLAARAEQVGLNRRLAIETMPITGWIHTHARTSLGTDSAAGATALASGEKVKPGRLSLHSDGTVFRTLLEAARDEGLATGVMTDSYLWDATSGAFLVHVARRGEYAEVARQMAASGADLLAGTLTRRFPLDGYDEATAIADLETGGFAVARDWDGVSELPVVGPVALLFDYGTIADGTQEPNHSAVAALALNRLSRNPEGFVLVIETEETDTASHHNDFQRMVAGIAALDQTVDALLDFARRDRQTLVLLTADHECGGLSLHNASPGDSLDVSWSTRGHTASPVPLFAYGPGAERFSGALDNTEPAKIIAEMMDWQIGAVESP